VPSIGKVVTFTTIRYPPKDHEQQAPYVVAIIRIEKGPTVIARMITPIDDVKIGSKVVLSSHKNGALEFQLAT
jgi:uncharacterized OB-fold protein